MLKISVKSWPDYFRVKHRLRWTQRLFGGIPATAAFLTAATTTLSTLPMFDPMQSVAGVDPVVAMGAATLLGALTAFVAGSAGAGLLIRTLNKGEFGEYAKRDGEYARRVARHRANVPPNPNQIGSGGGTDFYGERVRSLLDYRHWVKRQHALLAARRFNI